VPAVWWGSEHPNRFACGVLRHTAVADRPPGMWVPQAGRLINRNFVPLPNSLNGRSNMPKFSLAAAIANTWRESPATDSGTVVTDHRGSTLLNSGDPREPGKVMNLLQDRMDR
jgi:hypothetical protein